MEERGPRTARRNSHGQKENRKEEDFRAGVEKLSTAQILADEARYLVKTYRRPPMVFTRGRGCRVYDAQGREYLDFLGGIAVNALGHAHPRIVRVIRREAGRATHISNLFHNAYQGAARAQARPMGGTRPRLLHE